MSKWSDTIASHLPPIHPLMTTQDDHDAALAVQTALNITCEEHMTHKCIPPSKAHEWWTAECTAAVHALQEHAVADDSES